MTFEELRLVVVVYTTAIFPIIILFNMHLKDQLPRSILKIYLSSFLICALGWELWFTYGIYAGDPVDIRRSEILNQYIPKNINWLMNSLADAGTISLGGILLTGKLMGSDRTVFNQWKIDAFLILLTFREFIMIFFQLIRVEINIDDIFVLYEISILMKASNTCKK